MNINNITNYREVAKMFDDCKYYKNKIAKFDIEKNSCSDIHYNRYNIFIVLKSQRWMQYRVCCKMYEARNFIQEMIIIKDNV